MSLFYCLAISCYAKDYEFRLGNARLGESGTWASYAIESGTIINLIPKDTSIQIFCKTLTGHFRLHLRFYFACIALISPVLKQTGRTITLDTSPCELVETIKGKIQDKEGLIE